MAVSDSSSSPSPADWAQLYQRGVGNPVMYGPVSDSTVVTTVSSPTAPVTSGSGIEGRVGKSSRRRSRASRRAPTTMLNTDTTNFRALVQQFTGIASGPYNTGYGQPGNGPVINFSGFVEPGTAAVPFGHLQQYQIHHQIQQQQQQQQQQYQINNNDVFLQEFTSNPRVSMEGFFLDGQPPSTDGRSGGYIL